MEGRLQTRSYEQEGVTKYTTEIVANDMQMLEAKGAGQYADNFSQGAGSAPSPSKQGASSSGGDEFDEDIPF